MVSDTHRSKFCWDKFGSWEAGAVRKFVVDRNLETDMRINKHVKRS